jgi:hypothetical protein
MWRMLEECVLRYAMARNKFKAAYTQELKVNRACGGLIIYQGFMLKVMLDSEKTRFG